MSGSGDPMDCHPGGIARRDSNCFMSLLLRPGTTAAVQMRLLRIEESFMVINVPEVEDLVVYERDKRV